MKAMMTKHASQDRFDRIGAIIDLYNGEFGDVVITTWSEEHQTFQDLTSNGILIARGENNTIVTMFLCSINKAIAMQNISGVFLTKNQWRRIKENQKYKKLCGEI